MQRHRNLRQQQQPDQQPAVGVKRVGGYQDGPEHDSSSSSMSPSLTTTPVTTTSVTATPAVASQTGGFYLKIYGLPASFDDQSLKSMFNNVKFVRIATAKPTPITTKVINQDGRAENTTIVKAKKLCQVETQLDLERALTRQDERVGKSKVIYLFIENY